MKKLFNKTMLKSIKRMLLNRFQLEISHPQESKNVKNN